MVIPPNNEDFIEAVVIYQALDANGRKISGEVLVNLAIAKIYKSDIDDLFGQ